MPEGVFVPVSVSAEDLKKKKKEKTFEQKMVDRFLIGTLTIFATGGIFGYIFKLHPIDWILKCAAVELMLIVGMIVTSTIIWEIVAPKKKLNSFSLLGLAFLSFLLGFLLKLGFAILSCG